MRYFWSLCLLLILVIFFSQAFKINEQEKTIVGLWEIEIIEYFDSTSGLWKEDDWMKGGEGMLHYDQNKTMSLHFTPKGYNESNDPDILTKDYWYVGDYKINHQDHIIEHKRLMHSIPSENGKLVQRKFELLRDTLYLYPIEFNKRLIWVRANI
jgi:hypothetical protein